MSTKTTVLATASDKQRVLAAGLFAQSMQRNSTLGRLSGPMPQGEARAGEVLRKQTSTDLPIVKTIDLSRGRGDEVEFQFLQPVGAYPIMGSRTAEGQGNGLSYDTSRVRADQARFPVDLSDTMTGLRSPVDFRKVGRPVAQSFMDAYLDQSLLVHMAGARGYHSNIEWRVPLADHPDYADTVVNAVRAPTKNRHYMADGANGILPFGQIAGVCDIASTDVLNMNVVDGIRTTMESIALPPPAIKIPGDVAAEDSPLRCLLVSPAQYFAFAQDPNFRQFTANAMQRAKAAKDHPLFLGEVGLWNGIIIMKMPKPIRFYAGDTIRYCASNTSETESTCTVDAAFGTTHAIDRAILLGGQAIAQAFAASGHGGMPFFWKEESFDFDDKMELLIGAIQGASKVRWLVNQGNGIKHFTDHGVVAIDTAVRIIGARS
jgi:N4-gp56 family major capsid protein